MHRLRSKWFGYMAAPWTNTCYFPNNWVTVFRHIQCSQAPKPIECTINNRCYLVVLQGPTPAVSWSQNDVTVDHNLQASQVSKPRERTNRNRCDLVRIQVPFTMSKLTSEAEMWRWVVTYNWVRLLSSANESLKWWYWVVEQMPARAVRWNHADDAWLSIAAYNWVSFSSPVKAPLAIDMIRLLDSCLHE